MGVCSGVHQMCAHVYCGVLQCVAAVAVDLRAGIYQICAHICCSFFQCFAMCHGCLAMYTCKYLDVGSVSIYDLCIHSCAHVYKRDTYACMHAHAPACMHAYMYCVCCDRTHSRNVCACVCAGACVYLCVLVCLCVSIGAHVSRHRT